MKNKVYIGKIVSIEGLKVIIEITEENIANKLISNEGNNEFVVSIEKLVYSTLPNGKKGIARINKIFDKNTFSEKSIYKKKEEKYLIEAELIGVYDDFIKSFKYGINDFPIIGSSVYSVDRYIYKSFYNLDSTNKLKIGKSIINNFSIYANPDILFGKHLGVFGNTGSGKTCTIASVIQGLKIEDRVVPHKKISPKIIIFDSNNEYKAAFNDSKFQAKVIEKTQLNLPHYELGITEYYKFLKASDGVQAPVLKTAIRKLRNLNGGKEFNFTDLPDFINDVIKEKSTIDGKINDWDYKRWYGWVSTMNNRIETIIESENMLNIINDSSKVNNTIDEIFSSDDEIIIIETDFDKEELDIVLFLFSKLLYNKSISNKINLKNEHTVLLLEEAHRYLNKEDQEDYKLGSFYLERLAREGRKFGISLILSSQRPSEISKTVVSQCNSFIIHKITNKFDLDFVYKILESNNKDLLSFLPGLENQSAIISGEAFSNSEIIKVCKASPLPNSEDPNVIDSWS